MLKIELDEVTISDTMSLEKEQKWIFDLSFSTPPCGYVNVASGKQNVT